MKPRKMFVALPILLLPVASLKAATISQVTTEGDIISTTYLHDGNAGTGGGDFNTSGTPSTGTFTRSWNLNAGEGGSTVTITGLAFGLPGSNNTNGNVVTATISYLGADGVAGGGNDVVMGSATGTLNFPGAGRYEWLFDSPISAKVDAANSVFSVTLTSFAADNAGSTHSMRLKTSSAGLTTAASVKMDVAGTSVAVVPEPASALLGGLGALLLLGRRRCH